MSHLDTIRALTHTAEVFTARINDAYDRAEAEGHSASTLKEAAAMGKADFKREALSRPCPNCGARIGGRCTQPTSTGRRSVGWFHYARVSM